MPSLQSKHWCFTINNYEEHRLGRIEELEKSDQVKYLVVGREVGESGTKHLQGFVSFATKKTLRAVKEFIGEAHLETTKGSPKQAAEYCKKEGDFVEFGQLPRGKGARNDLAEVAEKVKQGCSIREIAEEHPSAVLRYGSGVLRLKQHYRPAESRIPEIHVFWGPTGSGKTRRVWEFVKRDELWVHPGDRWFDGYDNHLVALFDDFDGSWFKLSYLLKLLDRYMFEVPVKGGYVWWNPAQIYITSNINPRDWYPQALPEHKAALHRRLTEFGTILHIQ